MITILMILFFTAFFINLLYELLHSLLYKTCLEAPLPKYVYLILKAAIFDGFAIAMLYYISLIVFAGQYLVPFIIMSLAFAYVWEAYAIKNKRWQYSGNMPIILGVGITPFLQLALTGLISIYFATHF